jgi:SWI/SNF-related matrix-associated actin-dependent regulator of chromatin subfamily A3
VTAHAIRNSVTKQFRAVNALSAHSRWCLTGTPIQNSLEDLGAILKFMRMPIFSETAMFRKYITLPTNSLDRKDLKRFANLQKVMESICLRRTRGTLGLPEAATATITVKLSPEEAVLYSNISQNCRRAIDMIVSGRRIKETNQLMLEALLRMRLFCNNGRQAFSNQKFPLGFPSNPEEALSFLQTSGKAFCSYCDNEVHSLNDSHDNGSGMLTICHHIICGECIPKFRQDLEESCIDGKAKCSFCEQNYPPDCFFVPQGALTNSDEGEHHVYPTKLRRIVEIIKEHPHDEKR